MRIKSMDLQVTRVKKICVSHRRSYCSGVKLFLTATSHDNKCGDSKFYSAQFYSTLSLVGSYPNGQGILKGNCPQDDCNLLKVNRLNSNLTFNFYRELFIHK